MFFGAVPSACIEQMFSIVDFQSWKSVHVCCSGGFRIERAILQKWPDMQVHSNDVSLFSCAFGWLCMGEKVPIRFTGPLEFMEQHLTDDPAERCAAVQIATDMARFAVGKPSPYKSKHMAHYHRHFPEMLQPAAAKMKSVAEVTKIASYSAIDWRLHVDNAIATGSGIAAFPPFFKGDYEAMFKFIHNNVDWTEPAYDLYDPKDLESIVKKMDSSGVPYFVLSDQVFESQKPKMEYVQGRKVPHFGYGTATRTSLRRIPTRAEPFSYKPLDIDVLGKKSKVRVVEASGAAASYVKDIYLSKDIRHTVGMFNYFIYIDNMLAGVLIYNLAKYQSGQKGQIYLLSDVVTTRRGKVAKMVAKMALTKQIIAAVEAKIMAPIVSVMTTARTAKPVSMKYRSIYRLHSRKPDTVTPGHYMLNYVGAVSDETPQQVYKWWWNTYGRNEQIQK